MTTEALRGSFALVPAAATVVSGLTVVWIGLLFISGDITLA